MSGREVVLCHPATALGSTVVKAFFERAKLECCED